MLIKRHSFFNKKHAPAIQVDIDTRVEIGKIHGSPLDILGTNLNVTGWKYVLLFEFRMGTDNRVASVWNIREDGNVFSLTHLWG